KNEGETTTTTGMPVSDRERAVEKVCETLWDPIQTRFLQLQKNPAMFASLVERSALATTAGDDGSDAMHQQLELGFEVGSLVAARVLLMLRASYKRFLQPTLDQDYPEEDGLIESPLTAPWRTSVTRGIFPLMQAIAQMLPALQPEIRL